MSESGAKRGPKRKLTDSEKKRRKRDLNAKANKNRIYIGDQYDRWNELKTVLRVETNTEVARILMDRYDDKTQQTETTKQLKLQDDSSFVFPRTACTAYTSTPGPVHQKPNITDADISGISSSEHEIGRMTDVEMSGIEDIGVSSKRLSKTVFDKSSSFINPFDLTRTASEIMEHDLEVNTSDDDYEPSLNWTLRMDHNIPNDYSEEEDTDDNEDTIDEPEVDLGPGVKRIHNMLDIEELMGDTRFLVFSSQLVTLANTHIQKICKVKGCEEEVVMSQETVSSVVYFKWICKNGHQAHKWCSQPILNRRLHSGDLLLSAAIILSGNNYQKILTLCNFLNLPIVSSSTFHKIQRTYLIPAIDRFWIQEQDAVIEQFKDQPVILLGDGRMDSPGHSAQYCSYTFMESTTKKIMCIVTMDKRHTDRKSTVLEKTCFVKALQYLLGKNVNVVEIVTDAHVQIESYMKKEKPNIKHSFDIWHGAKNLGKKIIKAGQDKKNKALLEWSRDVVNHYWHCADISSSVEEFKANWFGIIHHVTNEHEWIISYSGSGESACKHGPLNEDREKGWLEKGSAPHTALKEIVMNKRLLSKIPYYLNCRSTSELENFQNLILKYASKRNSYKPPTYRARNELAALDHNAHCGRAVMTNKDGTIRSHRHYSKKGCRWSAYEVKTEKSYPHVPDLIKNVVKARMEDEIGMNQKVILERDDPRRVSATIAPIPPPPTAEIMAEKKSRLTTEDADNQ